MKNIHPAVLVTAGFFCIALIQVLQSVWLALGVLVCVAGATSLAWIKFQTVIRRLRFIVIAIVLLFAWQTPGTLVFPVLQGWSPTYDGLRLALEPLGRLLASVGVVSIMLARVGVGDWMSSLYVMASPLRVLGFAPERFAVRLRLVLEYVESRELNWKTCVAAASAVDVVGAGEQWQVSVLRRSDSALLVLLLLAFGVVWFGVR